MFQSTSHDHQPLPTTSNESIAYQADDLVDAFYPRLSVSHPFQHTGVLNVGSCHLAAYTGCADMYEVEISFPDQSSSMPVMAKAFRVLPDDHERKEQLNGMVDILRENWSTVGHDHISPIWPASVALERFTLPAIATPYYRNGNIFDYVCRNPSADCLEIVCQTASALAYIHSKGLLHGNICPENVCIADDRRVCITDTGLDTLVRQTSHRYMHSVPKNWQYKSPEELMSGTRTIQTDVYSFATTIYSIYHLKALFPSDTHSYGKRLMHVVNQGHDGIFGSFKPKKMSDELWEIIRMCWAMHPSQCPSMSNINDRLRRMRGFN